MEHGEVTILMPCLNEEATLATCIERARAWLRSGGINGEILVVDNGSTDASRRIAEEHGARVVSVLEPGYGNALQGGLREARGTYTIMGDADGSYDFEHLEPFLGKLREGYDLVLGNRFLGGIEPSAMPLLHRYIGNPLLSFLGRLFFSAPCRDFHCGLRGCRTDAIRKLKLKTTGMEFASEMVVSSLLSGLRVTEVPTTLSPDGRDRPSHLHTWRDGWRHLRFLLLFSPRWLFLYPGLLLSLLGIAGMLWILPGQRIVFDVHTMLYCSAFIVVGLNAVFFSIFARSYAVSTGLFPRSKWDIASSRWWTLERGVVAGISIFLMGMTGSLYAVSFWRDQSFGPLNPTHILRIVIPSVTFLIVGFQIILSSFFLSFLCLIQRND